MRLLAEVQNKLLKSKHKNISPRLFPEPLNLTTKPRTPPHICLPKHQI